MEIFLKKLQLLLTVLSGSLALLAVPIMRVYKNHKQKNEAIAMACLALLHSKLYARCETVICEKAITTQEIEELEALYEAYHALGGNGTGTKLYQEAEERMPE